jgi:hypothetical protein
LTEFSKLGDSLGFVCLKLQHFLRGEVFGRRNQKGKSLNPALPASPNSVNSVKSFVDVLSVLVCSIFFTVRFLEQEVRRGKAGDFLDRIDRIFKIREVFGFCLSWFAAFSSRGSFWNKKSEGQKSQSRFSCVQ